MSKLKNWVVTNFLPAYARQAFEEENARLARENADLKMQLANMEAYVDGLEAGMKSLRKIVIYANGEAEK